MIYATIKYETQAPVALITLNRPEKLNAWTPNMSTEMAHAVECANGDRSVGAIVVTGEGCGFAPGPISSTLSNRVSTATIPAPTRPKGKAGCPMGSIGSGWCAGQSR